MNNFNLSLFVWRLMLFVGLALLVGALALTGSAENVVGLATTSAKSYHQLFVPVTLSVQATPCLAGSYENEPNNSAAEANGPFCPGTPIRGLPNDLRDYFFLDVTQSVQVAATVIDHYGKGVQLSLYFGDCCQLGQLAAFDTEQDDGLHVEYTAGQPGRLYIRIYSETPKPEETRPYTLRVEFNSPACFDGPNEKNPNNNADQANGPLCHGATIRGLPDDKFDYFIFDTTQPGRVAATVSDHYAEGVQLALYFGGCCSESQRVDIDPGQADGLNVSYTTGQPGRFYIIIYSATPKPGETRPYTLQVEFP